MLPMTPPPACAKPKRLRFGEGRSAYDADDLPKLRFGEEGGPSAPRLSDHFGGLIVSRMERRVGIAFAACSERSRQAICN